MAGSFSVLLLVGFALVETSFAAKAASLTVYCSYPPCCKTDGIDYTEAEKKLCSQDECDDYSGCKYQGDFSFCDHMSHKDVVKKNIISFYSTKESIKKYEKKTFHITQGSKSINATVCDTCSDSDCENDGGCCSNNAKKYGYLVDMESNTYKRFGGKDGKVEWTCLDC